MPKTQTPPRPVESSKGENAARLNDLERQVRQLVEHTQHLTIRLGEIEKLREDVAALKYEVEELREL